MKNKTKREHLVDQNLELARDFLHDVIRHPERVAHIPNDATLLLYPVVYKQGKAA